MKRILLCILTAALTMGAASNAGAEKYSKAHVIGFYNLENLFDTYHDEGKNDWQYLPDGSNQWTEAKYEKKLANMARVIKAMAEENGRYHTILGVSEIENYHVLNDLVNQDAIADANFQIVHYEGPDRRGVDCALLYRPDQFKVLDSYPLPFTFEGTKVEITLSQEDQDYFRTRDILVVRGELEGEMIAVMVAHLPSRLGGKGGDLRCRGAEIMHAEAMKLMQEFPGIKVMVMGDMNDDPYNESMTVWLHGKEWLDEVGPEDFYDPFLSMYNAGYGSLAYQGAWCIFDIIMVNSNVVNAPKGTLQLLPLIKQKKNKVYYGRIFRKPFMTQQEGQYKDTPFRTFSGGTFVGGYSDHYPTYIILGK